jgi:hypothetical protein
MTRMAHFHKLTRQEQAQAIHRLAAEGWSDYGISHATQLAIEQVRRVLGERSSAPSRRPRAAAAMSRGGDTKVRADF